MKTESENLNHLVIFLLSNTITPMVRSKLMIIEYRYDVGCFEAAQVLLNPNDVLDYQLEVVALTFLTLARTSSTSFFLKLQFFESLVDV